MDQEGKKNMNRRDFMINVGKGAVAVGVASFMPRIVRPARAVTRDYILIGRPNPTTGPLSGLGEPTPWVDERAANTINKMGGIYIKEAGKNLPVRFKVVDTESNPTKAAELAARLILKDKIDLMVVLSAPPVVNPTSAMCERYEIPCICGNNPVEAWLTGGPYKWCYHAYWSANSVIDLYIGMWDEHAQKTNKVVGFLFPNDPDGKAWAEVFPKKLIPKGYKVIDPGRFPETTVDYTSFISLFKKEGVEIITGTVIPPIWISFWRQCHQQRFVPKIATVGKALLFPSAVEALGGNLPQGLSTEIFWSCHYPYKSSLTGETPMDLCDAWTKEFKKPMNQSIGGKHAAWERAYDVLKRAQTLDKYTIRDVIAKQDLHTVMGHIKYNEQHYCETPLVGGQWVKGDEWPWELQVIYNKDHPEIPITAKMIFPLPR